MTRARAIAGLSFVLWVAASAPGKADSSLIVSPPQSAWSDYQIIMWQPHTAIQDAALKRLGVSAGMVHADRGNPGAIPRSEADPLLESGLRWYVENIATDFYSAYHRYFPDRPDNWRFTAAQTLYRLDPLAVMPMVRDPSLSDPVWLNRVRARIAATVAAHRAYRPLYYNLADEAGIADLAAYWDFDFSPTSLAAMRTWLRQRYGTLAALNREWGSHFASWDAVTPATTREAMLRTDGNYASWADFKEWMDVAFARAAAEGRDAVHAADPHALAGLEGGQVPGWGGYDYARLVRAVDVMELYDSGKNVDIVRSLDPGMVILTTSFAGGAAEEWRVWHEALRGSRGLILWDEKNDFVGQDGQPGERGHEAAPTFRELRDGLGALLINSVPQTDPVAILYSPASMRVQWMLDWRSKGDAWIARGSEAEGGGDNTVRSAVSAFMSDLRDLGLEPRFVTSDLVEHGALAAGRYRILILPHAIALSSATAAAIRRFVKAGGTVIADTAPGTYDEHGKILPQPRLADLFGAPASTGRGGALYVVPRSGAEPPQSLVDAAAAQAVAPPVGLTGPNGVPASHFELHSFGDGAVRIVAVQARAAPSAKSAPSDRVTLALPRAAFVYDLRAGTELGRMDRIPLSPCAVAPAILAVSDAALPGPTLSVPGRLRPGDVANLRLGLAGPARAAVDVFHIEVTNPGGEAMPAYSGTVVARHGVASVGLPLAFNDPAGLWTIRVTDWPSGQSATARLEVAPGP